MTHMPLGLFFKKWQPKVDLAGYDILFAYFLVEVKSKIQPIVRCMYVCVPRRTHIQINTQDIEIGDLFAYFIVSEKQNITNINVNCVWKLIS